MQIIEQFFGSTTAFIISNNGANQILLKFSSEFIVLFHDVKKNVCKQQNSPGWTVEKRTLLHMIV
jgi:hypothetical protein